MSKMVQAETIPVQDRRPQRPRTLRGEVKLKGKVSVGLRPHSLVRKAGGRQGCIQNQLLLYKYKRSGG